MESENSGVMEGILKHGLKLRHAMLRYLSANSSGAREPGVLSSIA